MTNKIVDIHLRLILKDKNMKLLIQIIDEENKSMLEVRNDNGSFEIDGFGFDGNAGAIQILNAAAEGIPHMLNGLAKSIEKK